MCADHSTGRSRAADGSALRSRGKGRLGSGTDDFSEPRRSLLSMTSPAYGGLCARRVGRGLGFEGAEPLLEEPVGALEVGAQTLDGRRTGSTGKRLRTRVAEELPVHADEHVRRDLRVELVGAELAPDRLR